MPAPAHGVALEAARKAQRHLGAHFRPLFPEQAAILRFPPHHTARHRGENVLAGE